MNAVAESTHSYEEMHKKCLSNIPYDAGKIVSAAGGTELLSTVLVIDDDVAMTETLSVMLEPKAFKVFTAHTSEEGIAAASWLQPDVIVLDLHLPGMDSSLCRTIRESSGVPILVLSALNKPGVAAQALDDGADDYLTKPVPSGVLVAHLNNLIRRARAERDAYQKGSLQGF